MHYYFYEKNVLRNFIATFCDTLYDSTSLIHESLQIVKMDATANDVPPTFVVHGFPTIYWSPKNTKEPKKYEGGRDLNNFIEYIAKHATEELSGYDRDGKLKSKDEL